MTNLHIACLNPDIGPLLPFNWEYTLSSPASLNLWLELEIPSLPILGLQFAGGRPRTFSASIKAQTDPYNTSP